MGRLCERLAREVGMTAEQAELLRHASALHDVGKVGITDDILLKPGKLDPAEWATMKTHTTIGASILSGSWSELVQLAEQIALSHHERWDGSGYPDRLAGKQIPPAARVFAIADTLDALTTDRPYRGAVSFAQARAEILRGAGTQFDPAMIAAYETIGDDTLARLGEAVRSGGA
jgi:putative two-component system response regulator